MKFNRVDLAGKKHHGMAPAAAVFAASGLVLGAGDLIKLPATVSVAFTA